MAEATSNISANFFWVFILRTWLVPGKSNEAKGVVEWGNEGSFTDHRSCGCASETMHAFSSQRDCHSDLRTKAMQSIRAGTLMYEAHSARR